MQTKGVKGKPDFYFAANRVAIFVDGCFWHGCSVCGHVPSVNRAFWKTKINRNRQRDRDTDKFLQETGVIPIRLWEHQLRECPRECLQQVLEALDLTSSMANEDTHAFAAEKNCGRGKGAGNH